MDSDHVEVQGSAIDVVVPRDARTWRELAMEAVAVLPNVVKLLFRLMRDPRVPLRRKVLVAAVVTYIISPIDLIPDFIIGFGYLDDIVLASLALDHLMSGTDEPVILENWDGSIDSLDLVLSVFGWTASVFPSVLSRFLPK